MRILGPSFSEYLPAILFEVMLNMTTPNSLQPWLAFSSLCQGDGEKDIVRKACSWTAACDSYSTDGKFDWRNGMQLDLTVNSIRYSHIFERKSQWYCNTMTIKEVSLELSVDAFGKS